METYPENAPHTLLLGGEVFILDSDVALLPEPTVHMSYAGSATEGCHCQAMLIHIVVRRDVVPVSSGGQRRRAGGEKEGREERPGGG
jgi:hypothetical protein